MGELVKALLDLFTQTVDHVWLHLIAVRGGRDRTRHSMARRGSVVGLRQVQKGESSPKGALRFGCINASERPTCTGPMAAEDGPPGYD